MRNLPGELFRKGRALLGGAVVLGVVAVLAGGTRPTVATQPTGIPSWVTAPAKPAAPLDAAHQLSAAAQAPGVRQPVFAPDSRFPEVDTPAELGRQESVARRALNLSGCSICMSGNASASWTGSSGSFTLDYLTNYGGSTSGSLRLQLWVTDTYPTTSGFYYYNLSDYYSLGPLNSGYQWTNINSGTKTFATNIPTGTYYLMMSALEYTGSTWATRDWVVFPKLVNCTNGYGCSVVNTTPTPTTPPTTCSTADGQTLCLHGGRFKVQADYMDYGHNYGTGKAVALTDDSGYFWFFSSTNVELVCKIVSFCNGSSGNYGFYGSGLTDVQVNFKVTDTKNGTYRTYPNALGHGFTTFGDGGYTCP